MFTNGVPLAKNDDKNDFKSLKLTHRNDSDSSESSETIYVNRQDNGDDHKHLSKRAAFTTDQRKFQNDMLYAHNYYRSYYCAQALQLDDTLSRSAQNFAEKLAYANQFYHSGTQGVGENLYMASGMTINGYTAVISWYKEIQKYNFNSGGFSMATGHFTQLVWKSTTRVGVGVAYGNGGRSVYVVAQYTPPGNVIGQFQANVRPQGSC